MSGARDVFDTAIDLCADRRRRTLLAVLVDRRQPLSLDDMTRLLLRRDGTSPVEEATDEIETRLRVELHHAHVPALAAAGVVEYDEARELVRPTERFDQFVPHVSAILDADPDIDLVPAE